MSIQSTVRLICWHFIVESLQYPVDASLNEVNDNIIKISAMRAASKWILIKIIAGRVAERSFQK